MMLFKPEHIEMILLGTKTQTRRLWKQPRAKVGAIHQIKETLFGPSRGAVLVLGVKRENLLQITEMDAHKEGGYTREEYLRKWVQINPKSPRNPSLFVVDFRLHV